MARPGEIVDFRVFGEVSYAALAGSMATLRRWGMDRLWPLLSVTIETTRKLVEVCIVSLV